MQVVDVKPYVVKTRTNAGGGVYWFLLRVTTDSNTVGWGEVVWNAYPPPIYKKMVCHMAEKFLIGEDPFCTEKLFRRIFACHSYSRVDISAMGIASGLEIACWDIIGKETGRPVYDLLGGMMNEKVKTYTYLAEKDENVWCEDFWRDEEACVKRAVECMEEGFKAIKFDPYSPYIGSLSPFQPSLEMMARSERTVRRIREGIGDKCDIIIGTHGQFTVAGMIRVAKNLEKYNPLWLEEPAPPENHSVLKKITRSTSIPVATGERLATKYEIAPLIAEGCVDIVQLDVGGVGGILEAKKIAAMADAFHMQITPHFYAGPVMYAAEIQLDVCTPNFLIQESIGKMDRLGMDLLLAKPFVWEDGYIIPSKEPGLGIEIAQEKIDKYSIEDYEEKNVLLN
jgi:2-dehydro-3-deoxyphosphogalactonate aldolase